MLDRDYIGVKDGCAILSLTPLYLHATLNEPICHKSLHSCTMHYVTLAVYANFPTQFVQDSGFALYREYGCSSHLRSAIKENAARLAKGTRCWHKNLFVRNLS